MGKSNVGWIITKDLVGGEDVGTVGPYGCPYTPDEIKEHGTTFRMYDDDGELYYEGYMLCDKCMEGSEGALFGPLDDFGSPNAGCTSIHYRKQDGTWEEI